MWSSPLKWAIGAFVMETNLQDATHPLEAVFLGGIWPLLSHHHDPLISQHGHRKHGYPAATNTRKHLQTTQRRFHPIVPGKNWLKQHLYTSPVRKMLTEKGLKTVLFPEQKAQKQIANNKNKGHEKYILNSGRKTPDFKCFFFFFFLHLTRIFASLFVLIQHHNKCILLHFMLWIISTPTNLYDQWALK